MKTNLKLHLMFLALLSFSSFAHGQSTAFTYSGRLAGNGAAVSGNYDLRFTLYDAIGGNAVAGPLTLTPVEVANGLFTVRIDFGAGVFTGVPRWLDVAVRPLGGGDFTPLTPRHEVTSSPYAIRAQTAGNVASGAVTANQLNTGGVAPTAGQFLSYDGGTLVWNDPGVAAGNIWSLNGTRTFYNAGNVGIGTTTPTSKLEIAAQDGLAITGFQPFLTLRDGNALSRIQGTGGDVNLLAGSFLSGANTLSFLKLANNGNVGIGSVAPVGKLEIVAQDALRLIGYQPFLTLFDSNAGYAKSRIQSAGGEMILAPERYLTGADPNAYVKLFNSGNLSVKTLTIRGGADLAEPFAMSQPDVVPGSVVVIDDANPGKLRPSTQAYDKKVAGIVSGANGIEPGISLYQEGALEGGQNVALSGRVYVLADASSGAITPGDLLTTSETPGHAMKVSDHTRSPGAVLGKAMSALKDGKGMVLVLVTLQ